MRDAEVQLSAQRLQELMLWHGKDEGKLPPAASLANLSRDTVAALEQLQDARTRLSLLRASFAQLFWICDSSTVRCAVLATLGAPPEAQSFPHEPAALSWAPSWNGLSAWAEPLHREPQQALG